MLCVGLWPFTFAPANNAIIDEHGNGIRFSRPAAAVEADTMSTADKEAFLNGTVTIALRIRPERRIPWFLPRILSIDEGNRLRFLIGQWKKHLVVKSFGEQGGKAVGIADVRDVLDSGTTRMIVIVTGPDGTRVYVDGRESMHGDVRLFSGAAAEPWRLALGGSPTGKFTWTGTLWCVSVFRGDVSGQMLRDTANSACGACDTTLGARRMLGYSFDRPDTLVRDCGGSRTLMVKRRFPLVPAVLVPPWRDFTGDASYYSDIVVNVLGFVPFGFFLAGFLARRRAGAKLRTIAIAVAAGFAISLCIELLQVLLPGRSSQMSDLITNTLGTLAGAYAGFLSFKLKQREKSF